MGENIKKILIVDDEKPICDIIGDYLRINGYCFRYTTDPFEAMTLLESGDFDLVISDIRMRGLDGVRLMLHTRQRRADVDFIIMSAHANEYSYKDIVDAGASDFILKPFSLGELEAKLKRLEKERQTLTLLKEANEKLRLSNLELRSTLMGTVSSLASVTEFKDPYTAGHQERVAAISRAIAEKIDLGQEEVGAVYIAGLLHDIGKISVPAGILSKPTKLKPAEMDLIREHAQAGFEIIRDVKFPWPVAEVVQQHHERLDGSGYPAGLKGDQVLDNAKIIAVADVVEAMMSHRPYRAALGKEMALEEISSKKGILYEPRVVDACIGLLSQNESLPFGGAGPAMGWATIQQT